MIIQCRTDLMSHSASAYSPLGLRRLALVMIRHSSLHAFLSGQSSTNCNDSPKLNRLPQISFTGK